MGESGPRGESPGPRSSYLGGVTFSGDQDTLLPAHPEPGDAFDGEVRIENVRWRSDDGGFAVVDVSLADGSPVCVVGALGHLEESSRARVRGRFEMHSRHGLQITADSAEPLDPAGAEGARLYLKTIPGIGNKRAERLIDKYGDDLFDVVDQDPVAVFAAIPGVGAETAAQAAEEWYERRAQRHLYSLLAPQGLGRHVGELISTYGALAVETIREDPYVLTSFHGIGFRSADALALSIGIEPGSPERTHAAAVHALLEAENSGHSHQPIGELIETMRTLLGTEPSMGLIRSAPGVIIEGTLVYREWTLQAERWIAATLKSRAGAKADEGDAPKEAEVAGLTESQREGISNALTHRLSVITGGPGTGKTHLTDALARIAGERELEIMLLAPTGRAARRLTEATGGAAAFTIHKALEWVPGEIPGRDEENPIEADIVVVDESSMLSLEICRFLLAGVSSESKLVLIGDADQLPPVGPGKPFCELIESGIAPTVRLEEVFRQAARSMIVSAAHSIRHGERPRAEPGENEIHDFFVQNKSSAAELAADVVTMATERIPAKFSLDPIRDVQILAPQYRGELGIDALHIRMRDALCGGAERILEGRFRIGEKVITTRSLPEQRIANGTVFIIDGVDNDTSELQLENDSGDLVPLPFSDATALRGGFCASVHKAQGFEIPAVIVCLHSSHAPQLLSRNLLYTAVTRARQLCILAGDQRALGRALANTDALSRYSRLVDRLTD